MRFFLRFLQYSHFCFHKITSYLSYLQPRKLRIQRRESNQFGYYSHQGNRQWNIAPGTYELKIGASSQDIRLKQQIVLSGDKVVKPLRDHYFSEVIR